MPTCEHGLRSTECYTCASPKHGAFVQDQRKPLTDEEIADIYIKWDTTPGVSMADFARAIERAHGIGGPNE